jgi:hypothetical protein
MGDWIGLAVVGFIVLCGVFALWQLSKPYDISVEEFEKRAAEAPSLLSAGFVGLQNILDPATAKAVQAQENFKEGRFDSEQAKGDGDEAGGKQEQEAGGSRRKVVGTDFFQSVLSERREGRTGKAELTGRNARPTYEHTILGKQL